MLHLKHSSDLLIDPLLRLRDTSTMLHPYSGADFDHATRRTTKIHSADSSGLKTYEFNSLGFRCEEFNPNARYKIFVCGCSYTFGLGLDVEETWVHRFKEHYAKHVLADICDVNLQNFADCGGSNDYITRTLLSQCAVVKPDLVIGAFTYRDRAEFPFRGTLRKIGAWVPDDITAALEGNHPPGRKGWWEDLGPEGMQEFSDIVMYYFLYYSKEIGLFNLARNMLLVQYYCEANRIEYLFTCAEEHALMGAEATEVPGLAPLRDLINRKRLFKSIEPEFAVDVAADNVHPGALSNEKFAAEFFRFFTSNR